MPTTGAAKPARKPTSTTTTSNTFNSANIRDYEIIDDDDIDSNRKQLLQANRRRASSKQLASAGSTASNYKSNEVSRFLFSIINQDNFDYYYKFSQSI
jgi:hypothetical protein